MMEQTIKNNYRSLLKEYHLTSDYFHATGEARLFSFALENLCKFELRIIQLWSENELAQMQEELVQEGIEMV
ncbi:hypothetical protein ACLM5H_24600 [Fredinandcohnia humi]